MAKRGPLSKVETFYVSEHARLGKDIQEVATDLDRSVKSIEKCFTKAKKEDSKPTIVGDQFAIHKGSVVMTENASTMSDATRQTKSLTQPKHCVTKAKK